jgi:microcystin degradation protein MlrC
MLTHMNRQTPASQPMKDIMDRAIAAEASGAVLNASVFGGFPLSDIPWVGLTVAVVADADRCPAAQGAGRRVVGDGMANGVRTFVFASPPMAESIAHAKTLADGPVGAWPTTATTSAPGGVSDDRVGACRGCCARD